MTLDDIADEVPRYREAADSLLDIALANVAMLGEIPAPTGGERPRVDMVAQRLTECGCDGVGVDDAGNAVGVIPGRERMTSLLMLAHADSPAGAGVNHDVRIMEDLASGASLADNSLGVAALVTLPTVLEALDLKLRSDLVLLADACSLDHGNLGGVNAFLDGHPEDFDAAVCMEGRQLGRLSFRTPDMIRGVVTFKRPDAADPAEQGEALLLALADVVRVANACAADTDGDAGLVIGKVAGGNSYGRPVADASLQFELRGRDAGNAEVLRSRIEERCGQAAAERGLDITMEIVATRSRGGLCAEHPFPAAVRRLHRALGVQTSETESISELSALIEHGIPAVTIGMGRVVESRGGRDTVRIASLPYGMAQLIGVLRAADEGLCHES